MELFSIRIQRTFQLVSTAHCADAVAAVISTSMDKSNFFICSCFCCFLLMFPYIFLYGVLHGHPPVLLLKVRPYLPLRLERKEFLP